MEGGDVAVLRCALPSRSTTAGGANAVVVLAVFLYLSVQLHVTTALHIDATNALRLLHIVYPSFRFGVSKRAMPIITLNL